MISLFQFFDANAFQLVSIGLIVYLWKRQEKMRDQLTRVETLLNGSVKREGSDRQVKR